jgi:hypothetical protein
MSRNSNKKSSILSSNFDFRPLKMNLLHQKIQFCKRLSKGVIYLMGKKERKENLLATLKKHSYFKICEILKF